MDNCIITDLYERQNDLLKDYNFYEESAMVIGLGGIGSWVALDLALLGIGTIIIIDPDQIESSNLNRTLFRMTDIGRNKTEAIKELISERRSDLIIVPIPEYFTPELLDKYNVDYIFDCTDNLNVRQKISDFMPRPSANYVKCGYDGFNASVSVNDYTSGSWGEEGSYTIVPSFFGTPQIISALAVTEMVINNEYDSGTINFEITEILKKLTPQKEISDVEQQTEQQ
jgi:molybdopterin/thiamine biosynthesis adenylyltransferase